MKIVGPYTSPTIYSENPGIVELTSSDPSVASVDASVVIPGTRDFTLARELYGDGWECSAAGFGQAIKECSILFEYNTEIVSRVISVVTHYQPLLSSTYGAYKHNWRLTLVRGTTATLLSYGIRLADGDSEINYNQGVPYLNVLGARRACIRLTGTTLTYLDSLGVSLTTTVGTIVSTNAGAILRNWACGDVGYYARLISDGERATWLAGGARPSLLAGDEYWAAAEEQGSIVYAETTDANNGVLNQSAVYPATRVNRTYTDDPLNPVVPFQPFTITPNSTGTFTITARRRRQGVPDRAPDNEKYETTSETFTITEMPQEVVQYVRLLITTSTQGTVDIASSDPAVVTFPSSVVVGPTLQYEVLGTVVGAGTSIITTSMGGAVLDTTTVTIEAELTVVKCGPSQDIRSRI